MTSAFETLWLPYSVHPKTNPKAFKEWLQAHPQINLPEIVTSTEESFETTNNADTKQPINFQADLNEKPKEIVKRTLSFLHMSRPKLIRSQSYTEKSSRHKHFPKRTLSLDSRDKTIKVFLFSFDDNPNECFPRQDFKKDNSKLIRRNSSLRMEFKGVDVQSDDENRCEDYCISSDGLSSPEPEFDEELPKLITLRRISIPYKEDKASWKYLKRNHRQSIAVNAEDNSSEFSCIVDLDTKRLLKLSFKKICDPKKTKLKTLVLVNNMINRIMDEEDIQSNYSIHSSELKTEPVNFSKQVEIQEPVDEVPRSISPVQKANNLEYEKRLDDLYSSKWIDRTHICDASLSRKGYELRKLAFEEAIDIRPHEKSVHETEKDLNALWVAKEEDLKENVISKALKGISKPNRGYGKYNFMADTKMNAEDLDLSILGFHVEDEEEDIPLTSIENNLDAKMDSVNTLAATDVNERILEIQKKRLSSVSKWSSVPSIIPRKIFN
ncbi:hypothetical protein ROZALSC1DRAFT_31244 [Rozella allomycis CSF55]|uniref:Uncharacterized protein n=1 Tax=Rozella allomycis (strain CSF55) TaxID=988480 RepID=A0A4P9YC25_ROZAC|nr:hypothetical protein ROZALSC1DRAFT_31244 [Rozella allomycis CSF55]